MLHAVAGLTEGNINTLIQWLIAPAVLLVIGYIIDRRGKHRQRQTDAKVEQIPSIVSTALKKTAEQLGTKVDETREAVTNGHTQHIRDNLDEEFRNITELIQHLIDQQADEHERVKIMEARTMRQGTLLTTMGKTVARIGRDVSSLFERDAELERDAEEMRASIQEIEQTMPREQVRALARRAARTPSRPPREPLTPPPEEALELETALEESEQGIQ